MKKRFDKHSAATPGSRARFARPALALAALSMLAACGGGGSNETGFDPASIAGYWRTTAGAAPAVTAVVVPDASGTATAWLLVEDYSQLVKAVVYGDRSASGTAYALYAAGNATIATGEAVQTVAGRVAESLAAAPRQVSVTGVSDPALNFEQVDAMASPAAQADAAGVWRASSGTYTGQWTVSNTGSLSGSMTTGCSYAGSITALASVSAYRVQITQNCPNEGTATFNGNAVYQQGRMLVAATSADEKLAFVARFSR